MKGLARFFGVFAICLSGFSGASGQIDEFCGEFGFIPTLTAPRLSAPFVYGRITIRSERSTDPAPKVTVVYLNRGQTPERITISKSGNYCFRITGGAGGVLVVDIDGVEVARRAVSNFGTAQQREDFDVAVPIIQREGPPGVVSSKHHYPRSEKAEKDLRLAAEAETNNDPAGALRHLREMVRRDPKDFVVWGFIASIELKQERPDEAETALRRSIALNSEYLPAWITAGRVRLAKKQYEAAIEVFLHAVSLQPAYARAYQLLGEAYLLNRQGTLGAEALNKAIELDPIGMAECHLQLAHLYQLAKAGPMAAAEYRKFLEKVPDHPDRRKFEKFISENQ
ncbi:MAG TPA: tetratricopeptide repeat protein [Pyrinomonadaceae bacterium]|nr:tetratricopeptide repeat protein [Pyrinomonadaceae bacterium]HMP65787.1 tetratricopeptide repeat protein [Pyrinomonadaceae bacterium]